MNNVALAAQRKHHLNGVGTGKKHNAASRLLCALNTFLGSRVSGFAAALSLAIAVDISGEINDGQLGADAQPHGCWVAVAVVDVLAVQMGTQSYEFKLVKAQLVQRTGSC